VEQCGELDGALSAADDDDVPSPEATEVRWSEECETSSSAGRRIVPVDGIVVGSDRHHDRLTLQLAPILQRQEKRVS